MSTSEEKPLPTSEPTPAPAISQMRLGPDAVAKLDDLVAWFAEESGDRETRSSVVRQLIHREHLRRAKDRK